MRGLVIKNTGSWYTVKCESGDVVDCKIKGNFRLRGIKSTTPVVVGDTVDIVRNEEGTAFITEIGERRNYIVRRSTNLSKQSQILAANLDQTFLFVTMNHPETTTIFIDRFLASAEAYRIPVRLVFNKMDLYSEEECEAVERLIGIYSKIGYECYRISATLNTGIAELHSLLAGKMTLFAGHSGVGKSTLINTLLSEEVQKTSAISGFHDKGMHTTTFSEMFAIEGGYIIDTPGIKGFGSFDMDTSEISHYFLEIFRQSSQCKYDDCTHRNEPGCAVVKAVEEGEISESRYRSYLNMLEDKNEGKYRAPY